MASPVPKLPPINEFAPLDFTTKLADAKIDNDNDQQKLESGAPVSPAEAKLLEASATESDPIGVDWIHDNAHIDGASAKKEDVAYVEGDKEQVGTPRHDFDGIPADLEQSTSNDNESFVKHPRSAEEQAKFLDHPLTKERLPPAIQSMLDKEKNFQEAVDLIETKVEMAPDTITREDANLLVSRDRRAHGTMEDGGITSQVQSSAANNEGEGLTAQNE